MATALLLLGGCPSHSHTALGVHVLGSDSWQWVVLGSKAGTFLVRHVAATWGGKLVTLGGGGLCFSFGACFGEPHVLSLDEAVARLHPIGNLPLAS